MRGEVDLRAVGEDEDAVGIPVAGVLMAPGEEVGEGEAVAAREVEDQVLAGEGVGLAAAAAEGDVLEGDPLSEAERVEGVGVLDSVVAEAGIEDVDVGLVAALEQVVAGEPDQRVGEIGAEEGGAGLVADQRQRMRGEVDLRAVGEPQGEAGSPEVRSFIDPGEEVPNDQSVRFAKRQGQIGSGERLRRMS